MQKKFVPSVLDFVSSSSTKQMQRKTAILRKVCNAKPDAKLIACDGEGKQVGPTKVRLSNISLGKKN